MRFACVLYSLFFLYFKPDEFLDKVNDLIIVAPASRCTLHCYILRYMFLWRFVFRKAAEDKSSYKGMIHVGRELQSACAVLP